MKIAVLFDGGGLARYGLEKAGHDCTGYEIDPAKHYLSQMVGSGNSILADVRDVDLSGYEAVWASPPCQTRSRANGHNNADKKSLNDDLLDFSLSLPHEITWIENVIDKHGNNDFGKKWNAAQFWINPIVNRVRIIGGKHKEPNVFRIFRQHYPGVCPTPLASMGYKRYNCVPRKQDGMEYWYGRTPGLREVAYHMGFEIPHGLLQSWYYTPPFSNPKTGKPYTWPQWRNTLYEALGNGVPVYMSYAFGAVYSNAPVDAPKQLELFA